MMFIRARGHHPYLYTLYLRMPMHTNLCVNLKVKRKTKYTFGTYVNDQSILADVILSH